VKIYSYFQNVNIESKTKKIKIVFQITV